RQRMLCFMHWSRMVWCVYLFFAKRKFPKIDMSSRCMIPGPETAGCFDIRVYTVSLTWIPGTDRISLGLLTTIISLSSYNISNSLLTAGLSNIGLGATFSPFSIWARIGSHLLLQAG